VPDSPVFGNPDSGSPVSGSPVPGSPVPGGDDLAIAAESEPDSDRSRVTERWRLLIAYDGSSFRGFAAQPGVRTVAGVLSEALARSARASSPPLLTCAGRTDAGVHARGQVVHVDLVLPDPAESGTSGLEPARLVRSLNRQLAPAVVVRAASRAPAGFDARRSASARRYRYLVWNDTVADPLVDHVAWHVAEPLDLRSMAAATDALIGRHDFRAFCRRPPGHPPAEPIIRIVTAARWSEIEGPATPPDWPSGPGHPATPGHQTTPDGPAPGRLLRFDIEASSFCHQMVRSLVGHLVGVGRGRGNVATTVAMLRAGTRSPGTALAPPQGLCLTSVSYDESLSTDEAGARLAAGVPSSYP
jgi:tRNA pseudouridine38-40 synthase